MANQCIIIPWPAMWSVFHKSRPSVQTACDRTRWNERSVSEIRGTGKRGNPFLCISRAGYIDRWVWGGREYHWGDSDAWSNQMCRVTGANRTDYYDTGESDERKKSGNPRGLLTLLSIWPTSTNFTAHPKNNIQLL